MRAMTPVEASRANLNKTLLAQAKCSIAFSALVPAYLPEHDQFLELASINLVEWWMGLPWH